MAEIVNLRRARKTKARGEKEKEAAANRAHHGTPKYLREAEKARTEMQEREHASHRLERDKDE